MLGSSIAFEACYKSHRVTKSFIKFFIRLVIYDYEIFKTQKIDMLKR